MKHELKACLTPDQLEIFEALTTPAKIQAFLDSLPYRVEDDTHCPLYVMQDRRAHCLDGALFAAAALSYLGYPPQLIDLFPEPGTDDDHVLAIYQYRGHYGALAKSNYFTLRSREPIYRTLRELVLSYFEFDFNVDGIKTLRYYTQPLKLDRLDNLDWMCSDDHIPHLVEMLEHQRRYTLITPEMAQALSPMDELSYRAGMYGVNLDGVYKPSR